VEEYDLVIMENMQSWYRKNAGEGGNIDNLAKEPFIHASHASKTFLEGQADGEWCEVYMMTFFPSKPEDLLPIAVSEAPICPRSCDPTRYSAHNIVEYLWARYHYSDPDVDVIPNPYNIAIMAIKFIHGKYILGYSPNKKDKPEDLITRARYMGIGDFDEAWRFICANFIKMSRTFEYRKWVVSMIRDYVEDLPDISSEHKLSILLCTDDEFTIEEDINLALYTFRQTHVPTSFAETRASLISALDTALYRLNMIMGIKPPLDQHIFDDKTVYSLFADIINQDIIDIRDII